MTVHLLQDGTTVTLASTTLEEWRDRQVEWHRDPKRTGKGPGGRISKAFIRSVTAHYAPAQREEGE